jgi:hypothetical protein
MLLISFQYAFGSAARGRLKKMSQIYVFLKNCVQRYQILHFFFQRIMMKKQKEFHKVAALVLFLLLTGLSACRTCNCPAYSMDEPISPARQTDCLADSDLRAERNIS